MDDTIARIQIAVDRDLPLGVVVWRLDDPDDDASLRLVGATQIASDMVGVDLASSVGRRIREVFPKVTPGRRKLYADVARSGTPRSLGSTALADDWADLGVWGVTVLPVDDRCVALLLENVAMDEAQQNGPQPLRHFMDAIVDNMPAMVFVKDAQELRFELFNRIGEQLLGIPREDMVGKTDYDFFPREQAEFFQSKDRQVLRDGTLLEIPEEPIETAHGRRWLYTRKIPILDESGTPQHLLGISLDITEQKNAQQAQASLRDQLILADRMAAVGTLAAGVAHEINNPLAYVLSNLELIAEEIRAIASETPSARIKELQEMVNEARHGAERVHKIVRGMKTFSHVEHERRVLLDVRAVLDVSINMAFVEIKHRARIVRDYGEVPIVDADEARLGQVFINLLVNAAHAIREGDVETNEIRIVTKSDASGRAVIEIRDTGRGMGPDVLSRVFDPFFTTKAVGEGTGLGLSICRNIVTGLGGELVAQSEPGAGSTFRVVLPPANAEHRDPGSRPATSQPPVGRPGRVLVVDDDPLIGSTLRRVLAREHDVTVVTDGRQALDLIAGGKRFDVILCDLMMPQMTGIELYAEINIVAPEIVDRMVFMTGGAFTPAGRDFLDSVPNQRLEKPFASQNLRALVRGLVR